MTDRTAIPEVSSTPIMSGFPRIRSRYATRLGRCGFDMTAPSRSARAIRSPKGQNAHRLLRSSLVGMGLQPREAFVLGLAEAVDLPGRRLGVGERVASSLGYAKAVFEI
jgi:hypothetical protein